MGADLHLHTTASDGRLTPTELVQRAAKAGLKVIAITDHDTVDGIPEALAAAKAFPSLTVIPGVELSTDVTGGEVHVLGYFIDYHSQLLREKLALMRDSRETRARKMVEKLGKMGMPLRWERVLELAGEGSIGRPHIAQAMLEAGYIASMKEAFLLYISRTGPAYVVSTLALMDFDPGSKRMRLKATHPGVSVEDVIAATGFELVIPENVEVTAPPSAEELRLLREEIDPERLYI